MPDNRKLYKNMSMEEIIVLSQNEDTRALEEVTKRIQSDVYATLSYLLNSSGNIADLTQEVLIKIAKNIANLKNPKCFKGWVNHIITNTYYDFVRKIKRKPETVSIDYVCEPLNFAIKFEISDKKRIPVDMCISSECERMVKKAIRELPEPFRIAIILREFQGLSYEEIARTTNSTLGTVKSRISRARIKLQEALKNYI